MSSDRLDTSVRLGGADECGVGRAFTPTLGKKRKTATYVGSAQRGLLDPSQKIPFGVSTRVSDYAKVDRAWTKVMAGDATPEEKDDFHRLRAACHRHGMAWPVSLADSDGSNVNDFDGWTLESSAWWVVYSETREEHFASLCGGVSEAGEQLRTLWYQNPGGRLDHLEALSLNWLHLVEAFYILFNGAAPTSANGREWASPSVWWLRTVVLTHASCLCYSLRQKRFRSGFHSRTPIPTVSGSNLLRDPTFSSSNAIDVSHCMKRSVWECLSERIRGGD